METQVQEEDKSLQQRDLKLVANGQLVEDLLKSEVWQEIIGPELHKLISSAGSYQMPDGRWLPGTGVLPGVQDSIRTHSSGYQCGLMDFSNNILAFVTEKNRALERKKKDNQETEELVQPMSEEY